MGPDRNIVWDEENRMVAVGDDDPGVRQTNQGDVHFVYNDQGTRVFKIQGGNINVYVNQFYTLENLEQDAPTNGVANGHVANKHIFIGSQRIASQVVNAKADHEFDLGQGNGYGFTVGHKAQGSGECGWKWGNDEGGWNHFCEHSGPGGIHEGDDDQIQFVTALSDGVTVFHKQDTTSASLGTLLECQTATLVALKPYNGFYEVFFQGEKGFVLSSAVTVGIPASCAGVSPTTSVLPQDDFVFFYHADQVGSTGYMTDGAGKITEHLEYIPFGETWIQGRQGMQLFPNYEFSGKELDEETGLYYFGARYYDPRTSVWQSTDPDFNKYLGGHGIGVYNSLNLGLYSYCHQNPVKLLDPDGKEPIGAVFSAFFAASSGYATTKIGGGSTGAAVINAAISGIVAGGLTFFDPTDASVAAAGEEGAGISAGTAYITNVVGAGLADYASQKYDIAKGNQKGYNATSTIAAMGTAATFGPLLGKLNKEIGSEISEAADKGGKLWAKAGLREGLTAAVGGPTQFIPMVAQGIKNTYSPSQDNGPGAQSSESSGANNGVIPMSPTSSASAPVAQQVQ